MDDDCGDLAIAAPSTSAVNRASRSELSEAINQRQRTQLSESAVALDSASLSHLELMVEQNLANQELSTEQWTAKFMEATGALASALTPATVAKVTASRVALWKAQHSAHNKAPSPALGKQPESSSNEKSTRSAPSTEQVALFARARALLANDDSTRATASASASAEQQKPTTPDSPEPNEKSQVAHQPRLTVFVCNVRSHAVDGVEVDAGPARADLTFEEGQWSGRALFGQTATGSDEAKSSDCRRVGGTFVLTASAADLPKLEQLLELAAFAVINLNLEAALLNDFDCPRLVIDPEPAPPAPMNVAPAASAAEESSSVRAAYADLPSEEWQTSGGKRNSRKLRNIGGWDELIKKRTPKHKPRKEKENVAFERADTIDSTKTDESKRASASLASLTKGWGNLFVKKKQPRRQEASAESADSDDSSGWSMLFTKQSKRNSISHDAPDAAAASVEVPKEDVVEEEPAERSAKVIKQMSRHKVSTSPDVAIPPPHIVARMYDEELKETSTAADAANFMNRFVSGGQFEPAEFRSISVGTVASTASDVKSIKLDTKAGLVSVMANNSSLAGTFRHQGIQFLTELVQNGAPPGTAPCRGPEWRSFRYYNTSHEDGLADLTIGQMIESVVLAQDEHCALKSCDKLAKDHAAVWMHGKEKISLTISTLPSSKDEEKREQSLKGTSWDTTDAGIVMWSSCKHCQRSTKPTAMSASTYSFSWSKLLELVLYDVNFTPLASLCQHVGLDKSMLVRSFSIGETVVQLELGSIELFELRLPTAVDPKVDDREVVPQHAPGDERAIAQLQAEIESFFASANARVKEVARWLGCKDCDKWSIQSGKTIHEADDDVDDDDDGKVLTLTRNPTPIDLLRHMRRGFKEDEQDCCGLLDGLRSSELNVARARFVKHARAAKARIAAWEDKHQVKLETATAYVEPKYFLSTQHIFGTRSAVIVREDELSSIIALTLSTPDFVAKVATAADAPPTPGTPSIASSRNITPAHLPISPSRKSSSAGFPFGSSSTSSAGEDDEASPPTSATSSIPASPRPGSVLSTRSTATLEPLDPDDPYADFSGPPIPTWTPHVVKRKKVGTLLRGMKSLTRQRSRDYLGLGGLFGSPASTPTMEASGFLDGPATSTEDSTQPLPESILEDIVAKQELPPTLPATPKVKQPALRKVPSFLKPNQAASPVIAVSTECTPWTASVSSSSSLSASSSSSTRSSSTSSVSSLKRVLDHTIPDQYPDELHSSEYDEMIGQLDSLNESNLDPTATTTTSTFFNSFLSFPGAIRGFGSPRLGASALEKEERNEHIKLKMLDGDIAFRVTAYYAKLFATLRARCGLTEEMFVESLSRCLDLNPDGGKSGAAFWISHDKRFIFKELVTKWGASEREMFIANAPALLDYLAKLERPSLMAKPLGVYTVKVKNVKTGVVMRKLDIVVLENLFHHHEISSQYDLKGIATRVAKAKSKKEDDQNEKTQDEEENSGVGWDRDFVNGSLKDRLLIHPHSRALLRDGLLNDTNFLAKHENIDYSLLVGVDKAEREIVLGIIDAFGQFSLLKKAENAAKTAFKKATAGQADEVTVVPPTDYANRFRKAILTYFHAVPDKWSRPPTGTVSEDAMKHPRLACPL